MCGEANQVFLRRKDTIHPNRQDVVVYEFEFSNTLVKGVKGKVRPSNGYGVHYSDSGGSRGSLQETRLEIRSQAGSLVAVCGECHHGSVHLCCCHPDYEHREEHPGAKIKSKWKLAAMDVDLTSSHYGRDG